MPAAKIHWLREHATDMFRSVDLFTGCKDYVRGLLTGDRLTDPIDACALSLYDIQAGGWSPMLLDAVGITAAQLPEIVACATQAGKLTESAARSLGLRAGIPVIVGGGDDVEVLGAGLMMPGQSEEHLGTTGSFLTCTTEPLYDPSMALEVYPHAQPGLWVSGGSITTAGAALEWAAAMLGYGDVGRAFAADVNLSADANHQPLIFIPHLKGERSPSWNPHVRGVWMGLSDTHTRADLMQAAFAGVAHALNAILSQIDEQLGEPSEVTVVNRPDDSADWLQLRANIYGRPLRVLGSSEPTALGALILAATGIGLFDNLQNAVEALTSTTHTVYPDDGQHTVNRDTRLYHEAQSTLTALWEAFKTDTTTDLQLSRGQS